MKDKKNKNEVLDLGDMADSMGVDDEKKEALRQILNNIKSNIERAIKIVEDSGSGNGGLVLEKLESIKSDVDFDGKYFDEQKVVEGVFDGQKMIDTEGQEYQIPPNYISKSKLVEGDILKLTIDDRGNFVYKQIGPVGRRRVKAQLGQDPETKQYYAVAGTKRWKLITAAVTYFRGDPGDEVVILVPEESKSAWAAVENVIKS
ncbi:MAG: hypothetical protein WC310_03210 [Patescibacteria group bacterium]|jgi:hypothetical protein